MMDYQSAISEIYDLQKYAIKLGLDNIKFLMNSLNNPHNQYPVIHIAGTNGKGSTAFYIAGILQAMGMNTGLFTSPHLVDFRERIQVNGHKIEKSFIADFWQREKKTILSREATFFDTTTALGLDYFKMKNVDVAVVETGLGGRLDSTNIVDSEIAVITPIDFDHQKQLGTTLKKIAYEKAGIIKKKSVVFSTVQQQSALEQISDVVNRNNTFIYYPDYVKIDIKSASLDSMEFDLVDKFNKDILSGLNTKQVGVFQADNIGLAYLVSRYFLQKQGKSFNKRIFKEQISQIFWSGRLHKVQSHPDIIFDVSHNPAGIKKTLNYLLENTDRESLHILLGLVSDKSHKEIVSFIAETGRFIYVTEPDTYRKLDGDKLVNSFKKNKRDAHLIRNPQKAFEYAKSQLRDDDTLLVIGSHYLVGALLAKFENK